MVDAVISGLLKARRKKKRRNIALKVIELPRTVLQIPLAEVRLTLSTDYPSTDLDLPNGT